MLVPDEENQRRFRFFALGSAVALLGAAIALIILNFQRQEKELQARLSYIDTESGQIAARFKDALRELNNIQLQYAIDRDPAVLARFRKASDQLGLWLDRHLRLHGSVHPVAAAGPGGSGRGGRWRR